MKRKALISVFRKDGLADLARAFAAAGWELVSTGGTADFLRGAGFAVTGVGELSGFPECLDGRVKTLHPAIHAGILARRDDPAHMRALEELGIGRIDAVCVNLYPFFEKVREGADAAETIEFIDVGGPAMLRAAAKNHADVLVLSDPADYPAAAAEIAGGAPDAAFRKTLAAKAFNLTAAYDAAVARYLWREAHTAPGGAPDAAPFPPYWQMPLEKKAVLRYGENAHQRAALYTHADRRGVFGEMEILGGKELSYNNIRDTDAAWKTVCSFGLPSRAHKALGADELAALLPSWKEKEGCCCVAVKHDTPCAAARGETPREAFLKTRACDPVSIFGGVVAFNAPVDEAAAAALGGLFLEIVAAPDYAPGALELLRRKKNLRVLRIATEPLDEYECVSVDGGLLAQDASRRLFGRWETVTRTAAPPELLDDMVFGMRAVSRIKSNAIAVVKDGALLGQGGGETNRVDAAELALSRAAARQAALAAGGVDAALLPAAFTGGTRPAVLASDAFFPFADVVERAAAYGIRAVIQCGGSANDGLSIAACDKHGIAMVFTGIRCFRH